MNKTRISLLRVLLITILVCGLVQVATVKVSAQAPGVIVIIDSNTTWAKADSPHEFTGPVLVNQGVTLTIEAGATLNLNGYELRVNGTLRAIGTSSNKIHFRNGTINFTEHSNAWNEQTGSGSILQFTILDEVEVFNSVPVSINNNPIGDDNVWSKEESPIEFVGSVVIGEGEILTIEAGVTVEMQGYDLIVKGILRVLGSSSDQVLFKSEPYAIPTITFTETSIGWDEQTATGSIIDNAIIERIALVSDASIKIANSNITFRTTVGGSSIVVGNTLNVLSITGGSVVVSENDIKIIDECLGTPDISNNTIESIRGYVGSPMISGNIIEEFGKLVFENGTIGKFIETKWVVADSPTITNNTIRGGLYLETESAIVTYNTISGDTYTYWYWTFYGGQTVDITTSGIALTGGGYVEGNTISGCSIGIDGGTTVLGNVLIGNEFGAIVGSPALIQSNTFRDNDVAIKSENSSAEIIDNLLVNNTVGISSSNTVTIERNLIKTSDVGTKINLDAQATIRNNTYADNRVAIELNQPSSTTINYNNFENSTQSNIRLVDTSSSIDATNNWWGTTDTRAINMTIYDYKYEFDLGIVNFVPFLTEPNPEATSTIPEFPSWIILPLFVTATFAVIIYRKKLYRTQTQQSY